MKRLLLLAFASIGVPAFAGTRFIVVDQASHQPIPAKIEISVNGHVVRTLWTLGMPTAPFQEGGQADNLLELRPGEPLALQDQNGPPIKEISIVVRATRLTVAKPPPGASGTTRDRSDIGKFNNTTGGDQKTLVKGQSGVAEDSAGQSHVRGEHAEISYVVDGVPLPDTLAGRQGSVVVPSTIQTLDFLTGGYAPEFGGQTAAILNITTLPGVKTQRTDATIQGGSFRTWQGETTLEGPIGSRASYVLNLGANRTDLAGEPHQPGDQTAHNRGSSRNLFTSIRFKPGSKDSLALTLSANPDALQVPNRAGLPSSFADAGQGFGFLGLRNADGTRPDVDGGNSGTLGSETILLPSQQTAHQDIAQHEVSEFGTLNFQHRFGPTTTGQVAITLLHSGSDLTNRNPFADPTNLPVDSSIEFNPTAIRNAHHVQITGNLTHSRPRHLFKVGFLIDTQSGRERYQLIPGSQLALDALAAAAPVLAPPGAANGETDVDGNPVFIATGQSPTLKVSRSGYYAAGYLQDTWTTGRLTANYGVRVDYFSQKQNLGQQPVNEGAICPRLNLAYRIDKRSEFRASYNRLFNTPPLAQGAVVGAAIKPEKISQYDIGFSHDFGHGHRVGIAYYYKDIRDQVDTGLLIPGSDIGLYSAVNLQFGGVHGLELSYNFAAPGGIGWDGYVNYSLSAAKPKGLDSTGEEADEFNDHDQRHSLGAGLAYTWKSGMSAAFTFEYGSGLASSIVPSSISRSPRYSMDLHLSTGNLLFHKKAALTLDVENLTDQRSVINFQSAFSGTRFMMGRRIILGISGKL